MQLSGLKAVVTGGSRGIGKAIAIRFAEEGADVAITARNIESLKETAEAIKSKGGKATLLAWDVSDVTQADERLAEAKEALGGFDILVNNAGVVGLPKDADDKSPEAEWDLVIDINLKGLYFLSQSAASLMKPQKSGVIINIASDAGFRGAPNPYGVSKWGVVGFTNGFARQVAEDGIRVNGIAPGPVATEMMGWYPGDSMDAPGHPLGRYSLPEEIADVAVFLASNNSRAIFGHSIIVNTANS